jgi:hypothetical protein
MGAVWVNGAAAEVEEAKQRLRVATAGWNRWTPVNLAGIAAAQVPPVGHPAADRRHRGGECPHG